MKTRILGLLSVGIAIVVFQAAPNLAADKTPPSDEQIEQLVKQLGDDSFDVREKATKELIEIGAPALPQLRKAIKDNKDLELRNRAKAIIDKIKSSPAAVRESLKATDVQDRKEACERIAEDPKTYKELLPQVVELIKDKDESVRDAATIAVAAIDPDNKAIADSKLAKAMVSGKYSKLLKRVEVPNDKESYGEFKDYGHYQATSYGGVDNIPEGYWVYVYPYWYIWGKMADK